ncbi:SCP2 sterol-binding domain-containing protein [Actinokineospora iranica]|uniref:SCP-2 sterol transfer family protein n=1 Tax=Actinokineospora iranica TaxID=1271860 RepID=A0A1G6Q1R5_9PSEU|nr:SCP2 sterol-binding domain-containing protein [Actinokineospora iranica]SDC86151.1 SCP-2 sterol transfer family protein [Actinokineospora iranica]
MPDSGHTGAAIGALKPRALVELLDRMNPAEAMDIDADAIGRALNPRKLGRNDLTTALRAITRLAEAGAPVDLSAMSPKTFVRILTQASTDQIQSIMAEPGLRARVLGEMFRHMSDHPRDERIKDLKAVIHWRLTGGAGEDGYDRYETVIADGACVGGTEMTASPKVTVTLSPTDFLKLITNNVSAPVLFMTGKLKVRGDLAFAAGLTGLFDLPKP